MILVGSLLIAVIYCLQNGKEERERERERYDLEV